MPQLENLSLLNIFSQIHPISNPLRSDLVRWVKIEETPRKTHLLSKGEILKRIYFIENGLARAYYFDDGKEYTSWFMKEGDFIISVNSFYNQQPSMEYIELLEDCTLASISYEELQALYKKHPEFNIIGRILTEHYYSLSEMRLFAIRQSSAARRYEFFMNHYANLVNRVSSKQIASFLRMTPETLSRLRASF